MVRLYTSGKYFKDNEIIIDNDSFFNNNVSAKSLSENSINATECGKNALEQLFCYIDKTNMDIGIVLEHEDEIYECGNREYLINDSERITDLLFMV